MRGLKLMNLLFLVSLSRRIFYRCVDWNPPATGVAGAFGVASFTDAWIETPQQGIAPLVGLSHLLQMRGLKRQLGNKTMLFVGRIFYRCVDWNQNWEAWRTARYSRIFYRCVDWNGFFLSYTCRLLVASFTDAWIETMLKRINLMGWMSHLLQMRGLKQKLSNDYTSFSRRIFYRCVDWNVRLTRKLISLRRRIFYRCVDWNRV